jgi:hypothetical protein
MKLRVDGWRVWLLRCWDGSVVVLCAIAWMVTIVGFRGFVTVVRD